MKNRLLKAICLLIILLLCITPQGIIYAESSSPTPKALELHAFYPAYISYSTELEKYIDKLDSVSFAWSRLYADSLDSLSTVEGEHNNNGFYYPQDYMEPIRYAKSKGKSIQLSIFADWNDAQLILPYEDKRNKAIEITIKALSQDISNGESIYFDGVVIDFEGLRNSDGKGNDILIENQHISDYFNKFLNDLNTELDKLNKKLYVAVNPKLYYDGYDYEEIIRVADKMIIMAHDYEPISALRKNEVMQYTGYDSLNPIDSLAPYKKVKQALEDAKNSVESAEDLNKIWLQIAFDSAQWQYAIPTNRDWESLDKLALSKRKRTTPTYQMIKNRIDNVDGKGSNISYGYNNELQSPYIQYYNASEKLHNIIIYEDSQSIKAKLDMVKSYNMGGISMWSLGNIPDYNDTKGKSFHLDVWQSIVTSLQSTGVTGVNHNIKVQFADKKLEETVRKRLGRLSGDIYKNDVEGIYRLKLSVGVKNINDLKMFTNLEYLHAQNLAIKDIKALSSLKNLRVLYLQRNQITDISPLKGLTKLQVLSLNGNKVANIYALSALKELKELYLSENQISNVSPLANLIKLRKLNLNQNKIKDIGPLSRLTKLTELYIKGNKITHVSKLKRLKELKVLYLGGNKITDLNTIRNSFSKMISRDFS